MRKKKLKLTIELVPSTAWFLSLYQLYKSKKRLSRWRRIKEELFETEGRRCWICGKEGGRLEAHESWEYDDENHIQKLVTIHHLCGMCHRVKHMGFWTSIDKGIEQMVKMGLTKEDLIRHFCEVNNCSIKEFEEHEKECTKVWRERSKFTWEQNLGRYDPDTPR